MEYTKPALSITDQIAILQHRKNGFKELTKKEEDDHTRLMFFDMMDVL